MAGAPIIAPVPAAVGHGQVSLAQPPAGNPARWFGADAYPPDAIRRAATGRAVARLAIDREGRVTGCTIITSSGDASLDGATCAIPLRQGASTAAFRPALDAAGRPVAAAYMLPVRWVLPTDAVPPPLAAARPTATPSPTPPAPRHRHYDYNLLLDALLASVAAIGEMRQNRRQRRRGWDLREPMPGVSRVVALLRRWPSVRLLFWAGLFLGLLWLA